MRKTITTLSLAALLATGVNAASLEERVAALEETNKVLTEEVLASQTAGFTLVDAEKSFSGLGPAASKVYYSESPLSIGGYGEMYYAKPEGKDDYADVYRFITYFGYKFTDNVILNVELEYEHGTTDDGGKVVVEFMYLDFLLRDEVNLRLGHVLVPMGIINQRHEPVLFNTVQRPDIEKYLLPSTWHENGALAFGKFSNVGIEYTAGIVNALNMNNAYTGDPTSSQSKWIRSGRQGAGKQASFTPAAVARIDYVGTTGLVVGVSGYYGSGSNLKDDPAAISGLTTTMFDLHASYNNGPFSASGLFTQTTLDGAEKISSSAVEKGNGYYVNAAYDLSGLVGIDYKVPVFAQYEDYNTVAQTVDGSNEDKYKTKVTTIGLNFFPADQVVLKADYAMREVGSKDREDMFSFGLGFIF